MKPRHPTTTPEQLATRDSEQLGLFDLAPAFVDAEGEDSKLSIQEAFEQFDRSNPWVLEALFRLTQQWASQRRGAIGIGMLFEVLRWHYYQSTRDPASDFKLNNNYRSRYVRKLIEQHPELAEMFELRTLRSR